MLAAHCGLLTAQRRLVVPVFPPTMLPSHALACCPLWAVGAPKEVNPACFPAHRAAHSRPCMLPIVACGRAKGG